MIEIPSSFGDPDPGNVQVLSLTIVWRDGKIFLYAKSPVAPKKTSASEWELVRNISPLNHNFAA